MAKTLPPVSASASVSIRCVIGVPGDPDAAQPHFAQAREVFEACAAPVYVTRAAAHF